MVLAHTLARTVLTALVLALLPPRFGVAKAVQDPSGTLKEFHLVCNPDDLDFINSKPKEEHYIPITLTFRGQTWTDVRMRIRGDSSRSFPKKSYKVRFDGEPFVDGRDVLNFNAEYLDQSYMATFISSWLFRQSGQPGFSAEHARLYINGPFYGLYVLVENVDTDFLKNRDLDPRGNLYKATKDGASLSVHDNVEQLWEKKTNSEDGFDDLIGLIDGLNQTEDAEYLDFVKTHFDYKKMVNIIAMNMLVANGSTYYHNYYMYHDFYQTGKWVMFPWDLDRSVSRYGLDFPFHRSSPISLVDNPFLERAVLTPEIMADIRERITDLAQTIFTPENIFPRIDSLAVVLRPSVLEDQTDEIGDIEQWQTRILNEKNYIRSRVGVLMDQFDKLPGPFRVILTPDPFYNEVTLRWRPSPSPQADPVTYTVQYSTNRFFPDSETTVIDAIGDTSVTLAQKPPDGLYYWFVRATNKRGSTDGFDSLNLFRTRTGTQLPDSLFSDLRLTGRGSPYWARGDVYVAAGASLRAGPGVVVYMPEGASIYVGGKVQFSGASSIPVRLQADPQGQQWGAICFVEGAQPSSLSHVWVRGATRGGLDPSLYRGAVSSNNTDLSLDNIRFADNVRSVQAVGGRILVKDSEFVDSNSGEHISARGGVVTIENCLFEGGGDAIDFEQVEGGVIADNRIVATGDDGIDIDYSRDIIVRDNWISEVADKGISIGGNSEVQMERNIVSSVPVGVAAKDGTQVLIKNNTFFANEVALHAFDETESAAGGSIDVVNTIFASTARAILAEESTASIQISYSLFEGEPYEGKGNLRGDPRFVAAPEGNFNLQADSPGIGAGTADGTPAAVGTGVDIGALPFSVGSVGRIVINEISATGAGLGAGDWVELYNPQRTAQRIGGFYFKDGKEDHYFLLPRQVIIAPNRYVVLCRSESDFQLAYPSAGGCLGNFSFGLASSGEHIRLFAADGSLVDSLTYTSAEQWPQGPGEPGKVLALINPGLDNAAGQSWSYMSPSPGRANTPAARLPQIKLAQNYPNPFNASTTISFSLEFEEVVNLVIFDLLGRKVITLIDGPLSHGSHTIRWDGLNQQGDPVATGLYFYRLQTDNKGFLARKMALLK